MIKHGGMGRDLHWVALRQIDNAGTEFDVLRARNQVGKEHEGAGHWLREGGVMLSDPKFVKAKFIALYSDPHVFLKHCMGVAPVIVDGHHEHAKFHRFPSPEPVQNIAKRYAERQHGQTSLQTIRFSPPF